jgi:hypothetical protein
VKSRSGFERSEDYVQTRDWVRGAIEKARKEKGSQAAGPWGGTAEKDESGDH